MSATPIQSYNDLLAALTRDGVMHRASPAERSVMIPTRVGGADAAMILRWAPDQGALHVVQSLPVSAPAESHGRLNHALILLNHALALPGLTLDMERGLLFYRSLLPILRVAPPLLEDLRRLFSLVVRNSADVTPALAEIIAGARPPEDVVSGWLSAQRERRAEG